MKYCLILLVMQFAFGCATKSIVKPIDLCDDIELTNGSVVVEISPVRARITGYQLVGKRNILWGGIIWQPHDAKLADLRWNNYGGSRVWVLPQGITQRMVLNRNDPPDTAADGLAWSVLHRDDYSVVMQSDVSSQTGLQLKRQITLSNSGTTVTIHDTMTRVLDITCPVHIWRITQTYPAQYMLMDLKDNPCWKYRTIVGGNALNEAAKVHELEGGRVLKVDWLDSECSKVGSYGNWIAAVYKDHVFVQYGQYFPKDFYIDGANSEVYVDPDANMLEVESLSPTAMLEKGKSMQSTTVWKLLSVEKDTTPTEVLKKIEGVNHDKFSD